LLAPALGCKKVVVTTSLAIGILAADAGPRVIDGAAPFLAIEELAHTLEDVVFLVAEYTVAKGDFGVAFFGFFVGETEVFGEAGDVTAGHFNTIVTAAISRTLETIK
jgi:hypothetical protein